MVGVTADPDAVDRRPGRRVFEYRAESEFTLVAGR